MNYQKNRGRFNSNPNQRRFDKPKRAPLPEGFSLFYLAIECPAEINEQVEAMKDYMDDKFGCKAAKKSPAHLTIVPPFRAEDELQTDLLNFIQTFNMGLVPFNIRMKNYGQFADRVLFIDVEGPNTPLIELEKECMLEFSEKFPGIIFGMKPEFNPHVTIATRDIPAGALATAREYFELNHQIDLEFNATVLTLYRLVDGWWKKVE
jgi:2'-5' RNA ligase